MGARRSASARRSRLCRNGTSRRSAIALPGGIGTFNELFWVWTLLLHGRQDAPVRLVLLDGPWDELIDFLGRRFEFGEAARNLVRVASTPQEAAELAWTI